MLRTVLCWIALTSVVQAASPITAAAFAPDGKHVLLGSQDGIVIRSWPELKSIASIQTGLKHVHDLAFAPDGSTLLASGGSPAVAGMVDVIDWPSQKCRQSIEAGRDLVYKSAWSSDGKMWVVGCTDGVCRVIAAESGREITQYKGHSRPVLVVAFLPDCQTVVSAGVDQTLQVWDAKTAKTIRTLDNHTASVTDLATRPVGKSDAPPTVASVSDDRTVRLWNPTTGRMVRFARLDTRPSAVAWSPDGTQVLVGCGDGRLWRFDPDTLDPTAGQVTLGVRLFTLAPHREGKSVLIAGEGGQIRVVK